MRQADPHIPAKGPQHPVPGPPETDVATERDNVVKNVEVTFTPADDREALSDDVIEDLIWMFDVVGGGAVVATDV